MLMQTVRHQTQTVREPRSAPPAFHALFGAIELSGAPIHFDRNAEIYGEDESADYVYQVLHGAVRTYKVLSDGRRQINAFYLPGDMFGLEVGDKHSCSAEAVNGVQVLVVKRSLVMTVANRNNEVAHRLWSMTAADLHRSQNHSLLLIKSARERVAAFLLDMAERLCAGGAVELPMSRQDIADYLGLTIETVSRTLSQFEGAATIELPASRRIVLRNLSALSRLNA